MTPKPCPYCGIVVRPPFIGHACNAPRPPVGNTPDETLEPLDAMHGREVHEQMLRRAWLTYLVLRLPEQEQPDVIRAITDGVMPRDYDETNSKD